MTFKPDKYTIVTKDMKFFRISPDFLKATNSEHNLKYIKSAFLEKFKLYEELEAATDKETIIRLAEEAICLEFIIQDLFNYDMNEDFIRWWELPHCSCPKMDNRQHFGSNINIYSEECIIHGDLIHKHD